MGKDPKITITQEFVTEYLDGLGGYGLSEEEELEAVAAWWNANRHDRWWHRAVRGLGWTVLSDETQVGLTLIWRSARVS